MTPIRRLAAGLALFSALLVQGCVSIAPTATVAPTPTATQEPQSTTVPTAAPPTATINPTTPPAPSGTPSTSATPVPSTTPAPSTSTGGRPVFTSVDEAYSQTANWTRCSPSGAVAECATIYVPTDYDNPSAGTTAIAVAKFETAASPRGDLFVNPGGPGSAGIGFAAYLAQVAPTLSGTYDIVGFDPRGTGKSDPLVCLDTQQLDQLNAFDPTPDTPAVRQQGIDLIDAQGEACEQNSGLLASHVTTIEAAKDIDVIRQVLGDDKLDYFGFSYGTFLGTTYAALFPGKVDRFVLDGALIPGMSSMQVSEGQTEGFQTAVTAYIKDCIKQPSCPLGSTLSGASAKIRDLLTSADENPLPTGDAARPLTQALAFYAIVDTMYSPQSWSSLSAALGDALNGNGQQMLALADDYFGRSGGQYQTNLIQANTAINCLDQEVAGGPTQIPESKFIADSPVFGDIVYGMADIGCGNWPEKTTLTPPDYSAPGTPPILVVGTTRDPATPLMWAEQLAKILDNGVLLTRNGDGHTAYLSGNQCIIQNVNDFLIDGTVPANDTHC